MRCPMVGEGVALVAELYFRAKRDSNERRKEVAAARSACTCNSTDDPCPEHPSGVAVFPRPAWHIRQIERHEALVREVFGARHDIPCGWDERDAKV